MGKALQSVRLFITLIKNYNLGTLVLISVRMFSWRNKEDISIFRMKKSALSVAMGLGSLRLD